MKNLVLASFCFLVLACEQTIVREVSTPLDKETSVREPIYAFAFIATWPSYYDPTIHYSDADVIVRSYSSIPHITINGFEPNNPWWSDFDYNGIVFNPGEPCSLSIQIDSSRLDGVENVPSRVVLLEPADQAVLSNSDLHVRWTNANAGQYDLYVYYYYVDFNNNFRWRDTVLLGQNDTSAVLTGFLPDPADVYQWYYGYVEPVASNGPPLVAGTPGNLVGDGGGFMWTYYYIYGNTFVVGQPSLTLGDVSMRQNLAAQCRIQHIKAVQRQAKISADLPTIAD